MDLHGIRDLVASLFIMLNQKTYILFRVEFLVAVVTVLFLAMFIMDTFRRIFHNTIMKAIFSLFDAISDSVFIYLIGAMQAAPFKNGLFPVWALVLIIFRYGVDFISGYGVFDSRGRRFVELSIVVNLGAAAFLNWRHGSRFQRPLWSLFAVQCLRSLYRFASHREACRRVWLGWSSELISEYMCDPRKWKPVKCNPETMEGYRYLVFGERVNIKKPRYVLNVQDDDPRMITLDKIWGCQKQLLRHSHQDTDLKDLSLAFALSRLLRCRLEDVNLQGNIRHINRNLVKKRIVEEKDDKRAFGILERQFGFVNDYFNTRYPLVFCIGLGSLFFSLLLSIVTVALVCWLSVAIHKIYKPPDGELAHVVQGLNVDMVITWAFMFLVMFKETWEMVAYLLSDWTRLLLVCRYARQQKERARNICMEHLILSFFRSKINAKTWHGHLDQYVFLQSYDDTPRFWNLVHIVTTGLIPKRDEGAKLGTAIDVPEYVKPAIMKKLRALLARDEPEVVDAGGRYFDEETTVDTDARRPLPKELTTLSGDSREQRYGWACFHQQTSSHVILVWHVATNLCEMKLAMEHGVDLSKPGFCRSLVSWFTACCGCSTKPYLVDVGEHKESSLLSRLAGYFSSKSDDDKKLTDELRKKYVIASSLSNYCAYLLVSKPDLIPDSFLVPKMVLQETVRSARAILQGCDCPKSRFEKLMNVAEAAENDEVQDDVLKQGAMLAKELLHHEKSTEGRWEILAGVWTELLIHIAPTWNADAHRTCLESGGEFITNIWALLWHCNIEESSLWPDYDASEEVDAPPEAPAPDEDDDGAGGSNVISPPAVKETQRAVADASNTTEIHEHQEENMHGGVCSLHI